MLDWLAVFNQREEVLLELLGFEKTGESVTGALVDGPSLARVGQWLVVAGLDDVWDWCEMLNCRWVMASADPHEGSFRAAEGVGDVVDIWMADYQPQASPRLRTKGSPPEMDAGIPEGRRPAAMAMQAVGLTESCAFERLRRVRH